MDFKLLGIIYCLISVGKYVLIYFLIRKGVISLEAISKSLKDFQINIPTQNITNVTNKTESATVNNSSASNQDLDVLKELSQFKDPSKDMSIKLNTEAQVQEMDSSAQDALNFLKKKNQNESQ